MSYDLSIVVPPIPERDADAWTALESLGKEEGRPHFKLKELHDLLIARFPEDNVDESVWSVGPLWHNFEARVADVGVAYSRVEEVLPFVIEAARSLQLAVFDSSGEQIHRPDGIHGLTLTIEDKRPLKSPTLYQIQDTVDALTPRGGPGFMIVEGEKDYAQAAGGKGAYTAEWRAHSGRKFHHWVAGLPGRASAKDIDIKTNGFQVTVKEHERLSAEDAKAILSAFAEQKQRPSHYVWRDVTDRFG